MHAIKLDNPKLCGAVNAYHIYNRHVTFLRVKASSRCLCTLVFMEIATKKMNTQHPVHVKLGSCINKKKNKEKGKGRARNKSMQLFQQAVVKLDVNSFQGTKKIYVV